MNLKDYWKQFNLRFLFGRYNFWGAEIIPLQADKCKSGTWCVDLVEVDCSVDGVVDNVGVVVQAQVTQHLHAG